ncbi:nuclear transport factor 2 family protein [Streptomyces sp. NPDC088760]|uniref:nuclear transport factor 2 family protein n=1 Tax=Streptomyces sp. NPDC088760 TaxID=3365890 RepID=UPI00382690EE
MARAKTRAENRWQSELRRLESALSLTTDDRLEIHEVIALHGHLSDAGAYERFDEVFTCDLVIDAGDLGLAQLPARDPSRPLLDLYIAAAHRHGSDGPLAHHVTNVIVREDGDGARAWSKGMALNQDGSVASVTYEDQLVRTRQGWRIRHRKISARRKAGHGVEPLSLPG